MREDRKPYRKGSRRWFGCTTGCHVSTARKASHMVEIIDFFAAIGFFATLGAAAYFIDKLLDERKRNKLADESMRRLREERSRERLEAEWRKLGPC